MNEIVSPNPLDELKLFRNWIVHTPDKTPWQISGLEKASPTNPAHWVDYASALATVNANPGVLGLGFVLTRDAGFCVIDLDSYKAKNQSIVDEHLAIHNKFHSYSEFSPSGKGIHLWLKGYVPSKRLDEKAFEVFADQKYCTVTFNPYRNVPIIDQQPTLDSFFQRYWPNMQNGNGFHPEQAQPIAESFDVSTPQEILTKCAESMNGDKFKRLWEGKPGLYPSVEYPSHSEADLALCNILAFHTDNFNLVKKLYLSSPLAQTQKKSKTRPEWVDETVRKAFDKKGPTIPGMAQILGMDWKSRVGLQAENGPLPNQQPVNFEGNKTIGFIDVADYRVKATKFVWKNWLPQGTLTTLAGHGGSFKSTIAYNIAAIVASSLTWPDGTQCEKPGNVIVWSNEDDPASVIKPILLDAGYQENGPHRVYVLGTVINAGKERQFESSDILSLTSPCKQIGDVKLIIIDPLVRIVGGNSHHANDVTKSLDPVMALAKETGAAIIGIVHYTKAAMYERAIHRINGSAAFSNVARMNLMVATDVDKPLEGVITRGKANGAPTGGGFKYTGVINTKTDDEGISYTVPSVAFDSTLIEGTPEKILGMMNSQEPKQQRRAPKRLAAEEFLSALLSSGPKLRKEIMASAEKTPDAPSEKTIERCREKMGIITRIVKDKDGVVETWWGFAWHHTMFPNEG